MTARPGFRPGSHVTVLPGDGVYLLGERAGAVLRGALYERLAPLLDGTRTPDALVDALAETTTAAEVYYALSELTARGYVCDVDPTASPVQAGFWSGLGSDAVQVTSRLQITPVDVVRIGAVDVAGITAALGTFGVPVGSNGRLAVVVTDDYLQPGLADFNAQALETGRPWLLCKPGGSVVWVGPLFRPGVSACWECLAQRLRRHRTIDAYVQARIGAGTSPLVLPPSALPGTEGIALALAALQVAKAVGADTAAGSENLLVTLDLRTVTTEQHAVVRRPQCARCGEPLDPGRSPEPPRLRRQATPFTADGGYRSVPPETTFARYQHHISPITGLVSELRPVARPADSPSLLHVYRVGTGEAWAWGKGRTAAHARAAALCEALETASCRFHGDEPRVRASYRSLGDRAIHPNACMLFSETQYARRAEWNATSGRLRRIPEPFDEDAAIDWVHVWSLTHDTFRLLPAEYCYYHHPDRPARSVADPNGHGAGNTLEEAVRHALLELIERDAAAIWWFNRARRPAVDMDSFDDPFAHAVSAHYIRNGRELWVLDLTSDLGIPVFAAISRAREGAERISFGFGADFDPGVALARALVEMDQLACTFAEAKDPWFQRWWRDATMAGHPYLTPHASAPPSRRRDHLSPVDRDSVSAIMECRKRLEQQGLEVLMLDQTRPDIGLPTVQAVVPGLCHWRPPRFAPGRLYDVPVRLGWSAHPLTEDQLNPVFPPA